MALFSSQRSDNQALSHFLSNSPWLYRNLSRSVRTKAIEIIGTNGAIILDGSGAKNPNIEAKISFTTKNVIKQNISQITSRVRQLFRITGL
jgi:hypothetical protein